MQILALERPGPDSRPGAVAARLDAEAWQVWDLYCSGIVREIYFRRDRTEAVLMLECPCLDEAQAALARLPLVAERQICFDLIALIPYPGFARLFRER